MEYKKKLRCAFFFPFPSIIHCLVRNFPSLSTTTKSRALFPVLQLFQCLCLIRHNVTELSPGSLWWHWQWCPWEPAGHSYLTFPGPGTPHFATPRHAVITPLGLLREMEKCNQRCKTKTLTSSTFKYHISLFTTDSALFIQALLCHNYCMGFGGSRDT